MRTIKARILEVDYSHGLILAETKDGKQIDASWNGMLCNSTIKSGYLPFQYIGEDYYRDYNYILAIPLEGIEWDPNECVG